MREIALPR